MIQSYLFVYMSVDLHGSWFYLLLSRHLLTEKQQEWEEEAFKDN